MLGLFALHDTPDRAERHVYQLREMLSFHGQLSKRGLAIGFHRGILHTIRLALDDVGQYGNPYRQYPRLFCTYFFRDPGGSFGTASSCERLSGHTLPWHGRIWLETILGAYGMFGMVPLCRELPPRALSNWLV